MQRNSLHCFQGELLAACRAYLAIKVVYNGMRDREREAVGAVLDNQHDEVKRLVGNAFQLREDMGDMTQFCLVVLAMAGENHTLNASKVLMV